MLHSQFLMPGLVDTHIHAPQYVNSGTGYDRQLLKWLEKYTFPAEARFEDLELAKDVYQKAVVRSSDRLYAWQSLASFSANLSMVRVNVYFPICTF